MEFREGKAAIQLRRTPYDIARVVREVRRRGLPREFAQMFRLGKNLAAVDDERLPLVPTLHVGTNASNTSRREQPRETSPCTPGRQGRPSNG